MYVLQSRRPGRIPLFEGSVVPFASSATVCFGISAKTSKVQRGNMCYGFVPAPAVTSRSLGKSKRQRRRNGMFFASSAPRATVQRPESSHRGVPSIDRRVPALILAPMEVLGDAQFRLGMSVIGGFDEAVHEFMRIPHGSRERDIRGILRHRFDVDELAHAGIPLAAQIMCGEPGAAASAAKYLVSNSAARRVDLNCGCPSRRANSDKHGCETAAGASLLREPDRIYNIVRAMVDAVQAEDAKISVKMRSGFDDLALFDDCVCAARDAGCSMLTIHGRTRKQGYKGNADWGAVRRAVSLCHGSGITVVGNGDCRKGEDVKNRVEETGCHGVMIGRGAVSNSHIFWDARRALRDQDVPEVTSRCLERERLFLLAYFAAGAGVPVDLPERDMVDRLSKVVTLWGPRQHVKASSRLKMVANYAEWGDEGVREAIREQQCGGDSLAFLRYVIGQMQVGYSHLYKAGQVDPGPFSSLSQPLVFS